MYVKGIPDYGKDGKARETGLFAGLVSQDGELKTTQSGKDYGSASVRAFNRKDGTPAFMTVKSFQADTARLIANLRKGDRILCAGVLDSREYNGKTYTDMLVDFIVAADIVPSALPTSTQASNRAALAQRMESAGFDGTGEDDRDFPF